MGRWVRWFGVEEATATVTDAPARQGEKGASSKRVIRVTSAQARQAARSGTGLPKNAAPSPTGMISIEQLAAEMLTAVLVQEKLLTQADEHLAITEHRATGRPVEAILVETGAVIEADLLGVLSRRCKAPLLSLERYRFRPEVLEVVPCDFARANRLIPLERLGKVLNVATSNPLDVGALKRLEEKTELRVKPFLASPREVGIALDKCYPPPPEEDLPEEEATPFTTSQLLKESWLGLMGDGVEDDESQEETREEAPAPSEEEAEAPTAPSAERAVPLSDDDVEAFARVTSHALCRSWTDSAGVGAEGPLAAVPVSDAEFDTIAASEALPKTPPPKKTKRKKRASVRDKAKSRSSRKKAKKSRKKKSRR
jgi:hypothetical protein